MEPNKKNSSWSIQFANDYGPGKKRKINKSEQQKSEAKKYEDARIVRGFRVEWGKQNPWLHYDDNLKTMTCTVCCEFYCIDREKMTFVKGCGNFKTTAVRDHANSKAHLKASAASAKETKSADTASDPSTSHDEAGKLLLSLKSSQRADIELKDEKCICGF